MFKSPTYKIMHISRLLRDYVLRKNTKENIYAVKTTDVQHVVIIIIH